MTTQKHHNAFIYNCPHCQSTKLTLHGKDRGVRRYRCKTCLKTFKASHGTPVHGLHKKDKVNKYLTALYKGLSVRQAAKYAGISKATSFAWRHKFLSSLKTETIIDKKPRAIRLLTLEYSAKGRRKQPESIQEPTKSILINEAGQLKIYKLPPQKKIKYAVKTLSESTVKPVVYKKSKLLSSVIKKAANHQVLQCKELVLEQEQAINIQTKKLFFWMERFRGVASKYLQQYWNWYTVLNNIKVLKAEKEAFRLKCTENRSIERYFRLKSQ